MKANLSGCALLGLALAVPAQATEVLNIPFSAGFVIGATSDSCISSVGGGIGQNPSSIDGCQLDVPIPVAVGRTIKQISVLHRTPGNGDSGMWVAVSSSDFKAMSGVPATYDMFTYSLGENFTGMHSSNLMMQTGFPPYLSYPDAFVVQSDHVYRAQVMLFDNAKFHGLKVLYD